MNEISFLKGVVTVCIEMVVFVYLRVSCMCLKNIICQATVLA